MQYRPGSMNYLQSFRYENFIYFAVPKNGLITFADFFRRNGWEWVDLNQCSQDGTNYTYFSHIRNPHSRHTKGIVEMLKSYFVLEGGIEKVYEVLHQDERIARLLMLTVLDQHTIPITTLLPKKIDPYSVHWIPLDHDKYTSEELTNRFFEEHNIDLRVEKEDRKHQSGGRIKDVQNRIDDLKNTTNHYKGYFTSSILRDDLMLYDRVVQNIS